MTNGNDIGTTSLLSPHRKLEHPVGCVERGLHRAINFASGDLATPEDLYVSALGLDVHEDGDQILAESIYVIEVRERASKLVRGCLLYRLQSGYSSRFQGTSAVRGRGCPRIEDELTKRQSHAYPALPDRFL